MEFKVGDKVVYPNHGVGVIEQVAKKAIGGTTSSYYRLRLLSTDSMVMVPVDNTSTVGLRKVLTRHQYTRVFKLLKNGEVATYDDWKGRFQANKRSEDGLRKAVRGEIPVYFHASTLKQINSVLQFVDDEQLKRVVLVGGYDAAQHDLDVFARRRGVVRCEQVVEGRPQQCWQQHHPERRLCPCLC